MENRKTCFHCGKPVLGRSDKKYCTNYCRSEYNNKRIQAHTSNSSIIRINRILQHNRYVLFKLLGNSTMGCVSPDSLIGQGFHFGFHTHLVTVKEKTKVYCYDVGYLKKNEREVLIFGLDNN